jgi:hypothetical protein
VRQAFVHEATLTMGADHDERAPGAAITIALCGRLDHEPPCPLAPHHTAAEREGDRVRLRILFAVERAREAEVRGRIGGALALGRLAGSDGKVTRWRLASDGAGSVRPSEVDHAGRLLAC